MTTDDTPQFQTAGQLMPEILADVSDLPFEVRKTAQVLADVVGNPSVDWSGSRAPGVVATACIYVADYAIRQEDRYSQVALAKQAPGSHPTIRKNYKEIPRVFFKHATDEDLEKLSDEAVAVLRVFKNAEEAGIGVNELDAWSHQKEDPEAHE